MLLGEFSNIEYWFENGETVQEHPHLWVALMTYRYSVCLGCCSISLNSGFINPVRLLLLCDGIPLGSPRGTPCMFGLL